MAKLMSWCVVFEFEWLAVSRRWQWYAARSVFVLLILAVLSLVWWVRVAQSHTVGPVAGGDWSSSLRRHHGDATGHGAAGGAGRDGRGDLS